MQREFFDIGGLLSFEHQNNSDRSIVFCDLLSERKYIFPHRFPHQSPYPVPVHGKGYFFFRHGKSDQCYSFFFPAGGFQSVNITCQKCSGNTDTIVDDFAKCLISAEDCRFWKCLSHSNRCSRMNNEVNMQRRRIRRPTSCATNAARR